MWGQNNISRWLNNKAKKVIRQIRQNCNVHCECSTGRRRLLWREHHQTDVPADTGVYWELLQKSLIEHLRLHSCVGGEDAGRLHKTGSSNTPPSNAPPRTTPPSLGVHQPRTQRIIDFANMQICERTLSRDQV